MITGDGTLELLRGQAYITDPICCSEGSFWEMLIQSKAGRLKIPSSDISPGHPLPSFSQAGELLKVEPPEQRPRSPRAFPPGSRAVSSLASHRPGFLRPISYLSNRWLQAGLLPCQHLSKNWCQQDYLPILQDPRKYPSSGDHQSSSTPGRSRNPQV